jgi:rhodanese-related sulfurtransferase
MGLMIAVGILIVGGSLFIIWKNRQSASGFLQIDAAEASDMLKNPATAVLDVRTPQEFLKGHIRGAVLVPLADLAGRMSELAMFKERPVLVYCLAGGRSARACRQLLRHGFTRLSNLNGGIAAWQREGYEIVRGD